jgi:hypothetical protein
MRPLKLSVSNSPEHMRQNPEVSKMLDALDHPLRTEIEFLRSILLETGEEIQENIKWNGPNYTFAGEDRITMKIHPPKQIQLIFHRGARKKEQPTGHLILDPFSLLDWRENDRAIISFRNAEEITLHQAKLKFLIDAWVKTE